MRAPARFTEQKSKAPRKEKAASRSLGPKWERHRKELPDQFSGLEEGGRERWGDFPLTPLPPTTSSQGGAGETEQSRVRRKQMGGFWKALASELNPESP